MTTINKLLATAALTFVALAVNAQEKSTKALQAFLFEERDKIVSSSTKNFKDKYTERDGYFKFDELTLGQNGNKKIATLRETLYFDRENAYSYTVMNAGREFDGNTSNVVWGASNENKVTFGSQNDHNYIVILIRDKENPEFRYCNALVWYENDKKTTVYVYQIYGRDPQAKNSSKNDEIKNNTTIRYNNGLIEVIKDDGTQYFINGNDKVVTTSVNQITTEVSNGDDSNDVITTNDQFIKRFGTLRLAMLTIDNGVRQRISQPTIASCLKSLCENYGKLLNTDEKALCIKELRELRSTAIDSYTKGLLELAAKALQ